MSQADELLKTLAADATEEEHIVIGIDRVITVPESLKKIAVQYDHNMRTVTFDCPRYCDGRDLSEMKLYINYMRPDNKPGKYPADNVVIDETDETIIHFDWTITKYATEKNGKLSFLVCAKKLDTKGNEENHWNSELNQTFEISQGLEVDEQIEELYPDIITKLLTREELIITLLTSDGTTFTSDKQYNEIIEAHTAGKNIWFYCESMCKARVPALMFDGMVFTSLVSNDSNTNVQTLITLTLHSDSSVEVKQIPLASRSYVDEKVPDTFVGSSSEDSGRAGLVPGPSAGYQDKFLKGDGTWSSIPTVTDDHINELINTALGVIENGTY